MFLDHLILDSYVADFVSQVDLSNPKPVMSKEHLSLPLQGCNSFRISKSLLLLSLLKGMRMSAVVM